MGAGVLRPRAPKARGRSPPQSPPGRSLTIPPVPHQLFSDKWVGGPASSSVTSRSRGEIDPPQASREILLPTVRLKSDRWARSRPLQNWAHGRGLHL